MKLRDVQKMGTSGVSAIRFVMDLLPAAGPTSKVFPPTYKGDDKNDKNGVYATETRMVDGKTSITVLLDSVQSQAGRLEKLLALRGAVKTPIVQIEMPGYPGNFYTTLDASHRIFDAAFRDATIGNQYFRQSAEGKDLQKTSLNNATPLFRLNPTALLFGGWDSHVGLKTCATRIARSVVSEIVGFDFLEGVRTTSRIDPLGIVKTAGTTFKTSDGRPTFEESEAAIHSAGPKKGKPVLFGDVEVIEKKKKGGKKSSDADSVVEGNDVEEGNGEKGKSGAGGKGVGTPAAVGYGNIPPGISRGGGTISKAQQTVLIDLVQIRKMSFPDEKGKTTLERDVAGRSVLISLALYMILLQIEEGDYSLRSRCQLTPVSIPPFEVIGRSLQEISKESVTLQEAEDLLREACKVAASHGLVWKTEPMTLQSSKYLTEAYARSIALED